MIAPDLLGHGDTDKPSNVEAYNNTAIARQLIDILDHEKVDIVIGVGHDWGSTVLSTTARLYTDRFDKLIFLTRAYVSSQVRIFINRWNGDIELVTGLSSGYQFKTTSFCAEVCNYWTARQALPTNIDAINEATKQAIGWPIYGYWFFHNKPGAASIMESADVCLIFNIL